MMAVDTYLMHDYEFSLRISAADLSYIANDRLFESNILRVRALASLRLFEDDLEEVDEAFYSTTFQYLTTAIACFENALEIYKAYRSKHVSEKNNYGIGLSAYSLGYVYRNYAEHLCVQGRFAPHCKQLDRKYLQKSTEACQQEALKYFKEAYTHFKPVHHLLGLHMSKQHEAELRSVELFA